MGVWVARRPCGCLTAASFDEQDHDDLAHDIGEWVLRGDTVEHRDVDRIGLEKCAVHSEPDREQEG